MVSAPDPRTSWSLEPLRRRPNAALSRSTAMSAPCSQGSQIVILVGFYWQEFPVEGNHCSVAAFQDLRPSGCSIGKVDYCMIIPSPEPRLNGPRLRQRRPIDLDHFVEAIEGGIGRDSAGMLPRKGMACSSWMSSAVSSSCLPTASAALAESGCWPSRAAVTKPMLRSVPLVSSSKEKVSFGFASRMVAAVSRGGLG